jgi:hypothetical protein
MDGAEELLPVLRAEKTGEQHARTGGQAGKKADKQLGDIVGSCNGGQGGLTHKSAHGNGVHTVV